MILFDIYEGDSIELIRNGDIHMLGYIQQYDSLQVRETDISPDVIKIYVNGTLMYDRASVRARMKPNAILHVGGNV